MRAIAGAVELVEVIRAEHAAARTASAAIEADREGVYTAFIEK